MAEAVSRRGVDPVDALIKSFVDGGNGVLVFLRAPANPPAASADRPSAQSNRSNFKIAVSKLSFFHNDFLSICSSANLASSRFAKVFQTSLCIAFQFPPCLLFNHMPAGIRVVLRH